MDEQKLISEVFKIINRNYSNIYILDIMDDKVYKFMFNQNNELLLKDKITYTEFIDIANKFIYKDDLSLYFEHISLNNLEAESIRGNSETKFRYRKLCDAGDYRWFLNIINYLNIDNHKLIFMMSEDVNERLTDSEIKNEELQSEITNYENRISNENDSISSAILEINNMLDSNIDSNLKLGNTKDYINSVFNKMSVNHPELNKAIISMQMSSNNYKKKSILIVDDSSIIRTSLKRIFSSEFDIVFAKDGEEAVHIIEENIVNSVMSENTINIVGVLLDLMMPVKDGFYVLDYMKRFNLMNRIPVAIISGDETRETRKRVYEYDIVDMLEKPFNTDMIKKRISKIINLHIQEYNLMNLVNVQTENIVDNDKIKNVMEKIANNILTKDESIRLKQIVKILATNLKLDVRKIDAIVNTCPLYNIGAIAIDEKTVITSKTISESIDYGLSIIDLIYEEGLEKETLENIIRYSLELYNGTGYPNGLVGEDIPLEAQIVNLSARLNYSDLSKINALVKKIKENESDKYNPDLIEALDISKKEIKSLGK